MGIQCIVLSKIEVVSNNMLTSCYTFCSFYDVASNKIKYRELEAAQGFSLNSKLPFRNSFIRSLRSAVASPQRSVTLTTSWTKNKIETSSAVLQSKGNIRKRMTANHMGFKMPPHIDISRSTGNLSVMVGKQLILTCVIPNTGNESVSI